jgi:hypothetical protein
VRLVVARLPVEGGLERVLDRERAALDQEQVRQRRVAEDPLEGGHEVRELRGVDVGVRRLVGGGAGQPPCTFGSVSAGWFIPSAFDAKNVNRSR